MKFELEFDDDQIEKLIEKNLKELYYLNASGCVFPEEKELSKSLKVVLSYYMLHDEYKEWLNELNVRGL